MTRAPRGRVARGRRGGSGLKDAWAQRRDCLELQLGPLAVEAVGEYLDRRFGAQALVSDFASLVHKHSGGRPLSMVTLADHLCAEGLHEAGDAASVPARLAELEEAGLGLPGPPP